MYPITLPHEADPNGCREDRKGLRIRCYWVPYVGSLMVHWAGLLGGVF